MAERRMFAKSIILSDSFLDMPLSARCLYFTLGMVADDDGFVNCPKSIMRQVGASNDDLNILLAKQYVIVFESGVIVIKHWKIHNYIQKDRYTPTKYTDERAELFLEENGGYTQDASAQPLLVPQKKPLTEARLKRCQARKESDLPYSFDYKIRHAFIGRICPICGCKMGRGTSSGNEIVVKTYCPTIQHNVPISQGGKHEIGNISVICSHCNNTVKDKETGDLNNAEVREVWECIGNVSGMDTQDRLGKVRLGKDISVQAHRFTKPTVDEVSAYCLERKNTVDPQKFVDFYESKGWKVGNTPMKDWKACVRTWEQREPKKAGTKTAEPKKYDRSD